MGRRVRNAPATASATRPLLLRRVLRRSEAAARAMGRVERRDGRRGDVKRGRGADAGGVSRAAYGSNPSGA